jgi:hypothetical protein
VIDPEGTRSCPDEQYEPASEGVPSVGEFADASHFGCGVKTYYL